MFYHRSLSKTFLIQRKSTNYEVLLQELSIFRRIHLLVATYNEAMRTLLFMFLFTCGVTQVISAVTLITQPNSVSLPPLVYLFFGGVFIETILIILVVYGFAGDFYQTSETSLAKLNQVVRSGRMQKKERKFREKYLLSCQVQKMNFGLSNFIEKTTPLIFQLFCLERIIDILLLT